MEHRLICSGAATFHDLGYGLPGGQVMAIKLLQYLVVDLEMRAAEEEKARRATNSK